MGIYCSNYICDRVNHQWHIVTKAWSIVGFGWNLFSLLAECGFSLLPGVVSVVQRFVRSIKVDTLEGYSYDALRNAYIFLR